MNRIETYCQKDFIEHFFENKVNDEFDENYCNWNHLFDLLTKRAEIIIDSTKELEMSSNPRIKKFVKNSTAGGSPIHELARHFQSIFEEQSEILKLNPTSVHFFKNKFFKLIEDYGLCISDSSNYLTNISMISVPFSKKVHPKQEFNEFNSWHEIKPLLPVRNSFILADNYIIDKETLFEKNIYPLIDSILPDYLTEDFHFSIITKNDLSQPDRKFNLLNNYFTSLHKTYKIKFGLFLTALNKPHDRDLISNYFRINSGNSFDLFNEKGFPNKDTTVSFFPLNSEIELNTHFKFLQIYANYTNSATYYGDRINRLLDYFR